MVTNTDKSRTHRVITEEYGNKLQRKYTKRLKEMPPGSIAKQWGAERASRGWWFSSNVFYFCWIFKLCTYIALIDLFSKGKEMPENEKKRILVVLRNFQEGWRVMLASWAGTREVLGRMMLLTLWGSASSSWHSFHRHGGHGTYLAAHISTIPASLHHGRWVYCLGWWRLIGWLGCMPWTAASLVEVTEKWAFCRAGDGLCLL